MNPSTIQSAQLRQGGYLYMQQRPAAVVGLRGTLVRVLLLRVLHSLHIASLQLLASAVLVLCTAAVQLGSVDRRKLYRAAVLPVTSAVNFRNVSKNIIRAVSAPKSSR